MARSTTSFKPIRAKTGGRKRGTPNKRTQLVIDTLTALGCDIAQGAGWARLRLMALQKDLRRLAELFVWADGDGALKPVSTGPI